ncbi:Tpr-related protein family member, putative [Theileria annulata]|uniref:Tpr-related protein family member, putative n=1 Tax=Theileria annulata TaxID=5874 RepID=Q4UHW2_THEAN|nr:Tpr-related protein family member, putative [Theileria annulata]CAI73327.1 Tpr-related protein family member, putative [Theileria annulata]|eukprot:XP_954004.1 Tpr-related protein family member, putative [Theileria annulata]
MSTCPSCSDQAGVGQDQCVILNASYVFAGLAMMLNIRLSYSSAPYALIRFRLPENLFSVFVRRMASALELWCLPSMLLGNIMEYSLKGYYLNYYEKGNYATKDQHHYNLVENGKGGNSDDITNSDLLSARNIKNGVIIVPSIVTQWLNFITYVILLFVYIAGGDQGHLTTFYFVIAISGFVFGINMVLLYAVDWNYIPVYMVGENSFPIVTSFMHYVTTLIFGNRRKWNSDYLIACIDIGVAIIISLVAAVLWTLAYGIFTTTPKKAGTANTGDTLATYGHILTESFDNSTVRWIAIISPTLMVIVGMGLVYAIYPGIAPGMIVPFYLVDKIEMVLLIATFFPPVIVALLNRGVFSEGAKKYSPKSIYVYHSQDDNGMGGWRPYSEHVNIQDPGVPGQVPDFNCKTNAEANAVVHNWFWHLFDILIVIKISLAAIFIYSLHYRDSSLSRAIVNQPKMSTALSIIFYMCHEFLLALGFPGIIGNNGSTYVMLPAQYIGALFMIFLAFYSEGYIIEYKSHDPAHWPTTGMTKWNAFCYWCKRASKITIRILK